MKNYYIKKEIAKNYNEKLGNRKALCNFDSRYLLKEIKKGKVLDLGCGIGRHARILPYKVKYTGIDISKYMIKKAITANKKAKFIIGDICDIKNLVKDKFNYILLMYNTLGSIVPSEKRHKLFLNMHNLLLNDGKIIIHIHNKSHLKNIKNKFKLIKEYLIQRYIKGIKDFEFGDLIIKKDELKGIRMHFFSLNEIKKLVYKTNFKIDKIICLNYPSEGREIESKLFAGGFIISIKK